MLEGGNEGEINDHVHSRTSFPRLPRYFHGLTLGLKFRLLFSPERDEKLVGQIKKMVALGDYDLTSVPAPPGKF